MKWIICFCESPNIGFWQFFTKKNPKFSHVFAVQYFPELKRWVKLEFATQGFNFVAVEGTHADHLVAFMIEECTCVEYEPTNNHIWLPRLLYCVSFIKHLCNIRNIFILTPYQLYCELLKRGGQVIFEKEGESNGIHANTKSTARPSSRRTEKGRNGKTGKRTTRSRSTKTRKGQKNQTELTWC